MTRSTPDIRFCSRARRARCWTSISEHIRTSRHRTRFPAAPAPAWASVPRESTRVAGVTKAYTTRVGSGPFPTEMPDLEATEVRDRGKEYGAVTGRPRRCGWLDLVVLRYAVRINGISSLVVTKLDVFDTQKEIQVCTGYRYKGTPREGNARGRRGSGRSHAGISHASGMAVGHVTACRMRRNSRARLWTT